MKKNHSQKTSPLAALRAAISTLIKMNNCVRKIRKHFLGNAGETLLEVVIAVSVIMMILPYSSGLYISSIRNVAIDRNEIVASLLAEEGLELAHGIRDTNFLKFASKAQLCWDAVPGAAQLDTCDAGQNKISGKIKALAGDASKPAWFTIGIDPTKDNLPIILSPPSNKALDPAAPPDQYKLWLDEDPRPATPACAPGALNCHKDFRDDTHIYTTVKRGAPTMFYRGIKIQFFDLKPEPAGNPVVYEGMTIESNVLYPNGIEMRSVKRATVLTNQPQAE